MTTTNDWLPSAQIELEQVSAQVQQQVEVDAQSMYQNALAGMPPELKQAVALVGAAASAAVTGLLSGLAFTTPAQAALLGEIGISVAAGETAGPLAAVAAAVVAVFVAVATGPWASGSTDNRTSIEIAQDQVNANLLQTTGGWFLASYYWDLEKAKLNPQAACPQGGWGCIDVAGAIAAVANFYTGAICRNADACAVVTNQQIAGLVNNALHRMPPPDLLRALIIANGPQVSPPAGTVANVTNDPAAVSGVFYGDQVSYGASITFTEIYACACMAGAGSEELAAQTQTLITALQARRPELVGPLQDLLNYYINVVPFQGTNPQDIFGGGGFKIGGIHPILHLPGGGTKPAAPSSTAATVAKGAAATAVVAGLASVIYAYVKGEAISAVWKGAWNQTGGRVVRKVRGR